LREKIRISQKKCAEYCTRKKHGFEKRINYKKEKNTFILTSNRLSLVVEVSDCCVLVFILFFLPLPSVNNIGGLSYKLKNKQRIRRKKNEKNDSKTHHCLFQSHWNQL
jgi:hypothetical protein